MTAQQTRTLFLVGVALALVVAGSGVAHVAAGASAVTVEDRTVTTDETTTAAVTLAEAPDGLQRYNLTIAVADPSVASIEGVEPGDVGGFQVRSRSEAAVTFRAADLTEAVEPGTSDVSLGVVTVIGSEQGTTELSATIHEVRDDDAEQRRPTVRAGTLTVTGDGAGGGSQPGSGAVDDRIVGLPGPPIAWIGGAIVAVLIAVLVTVAIVRRRRRSRRQRSFL